MAFEYKARAKEDIDKRATQQGSEYIKAVKDEFKTFTPGKGDNWVRILPPTWPGAAHYGFDLWQHSQIGPDKGTVVCNYKQHNTKCPLCDARARAETMHDEELAKALKPGRRVLVWVINRKDEDKGPMLWPMAWTLDRDIAKLSTDKRTGEIYLIDHPYEGYDITFEREGEGIGTKYTGVQLSRRPSSVDEKHLSYVTEHPLPDVILDRTADEVMDIYTGGEENGTSSPEPTGRPTRDEPEREMRPVHTHPKDLPADPPFEPSKPVTQAEPPLDVDEPAKPVTVARRPVTPPSEPATPPSTPKVVDQPVGGKTRAQLLKEKFQNKNK